MIKEKQAWQVSAVVIVNFQLCLPSLSLYVTPFACLKYKWEIQPHEYEEETTHHEDL